MGSGSTATSSPWGRTSASLDQWPSRVVRGARLLLLAILRIDAAGTPPPKLLDGREPQHPCPSLASGSLELTSGRTSLHPASRVINCARIREFADRDSGGGR